MRRTRNYKENLMEALKDPIEAVEYLNAALEEEGPEVFLLTLRDVVESYGGMSKLSASTSLNRENLYRMLSTRGNPEFFSLLTILNALGFRLAVEPKAGRGSSAKGTFKKIVLQPMVGQVRETTCEYALAAETKDRSNNPILFKATSGQEVGTLKFDYRRAILFLQLAEDASFGTIREVELQTKKEKIVAGSASLEEGNHLVLLRKQRVFPKDVSQITLSIEDKG